MGRGAAGFSFALEHGIALPGSSVGPGAAMSSGGASNMSEVALDRLLQLPENQAEDDLDDYELWPVMLPGVNYAF